MLKKHVKKRVSGTGKPEQESQKGQTEQESQNKQKEQKKFCLDLR